MSANRKRVLAAMSGGVDSSVAALLLLEAGYDVTGATMSLGVHRDAGSPGRFTDEAIDDAKRVCSDLGIGHTTFFYADLMEEKVIGAFIREYTRGRTPNPCIECNRHLKFGALMQKTRDLGFDYLATGHFARIERKDESWRLLRAVDKTKDQSYFLYGIRPDDLRTILFPLGALTKDEVRRKADESGLHVAHRPESQDICFVPDGDYTRVFEKRGVRPEPGEIVDAQGNVLGRHRGIIHYTIGQRGGLGVSAKRPLYVRRLDARTHRVVVGHKEDLFASGLVAGDLNLFTDSIPEEVEGKIRYRKKAARCRVRKEGKKLIVDFAEPQEAITPGQAFVFYAGDELLGGGVIEGVV
ncbi:MAG TPA: tRNA 2-thiouridine(34) synthase MnmA [Smithellaceae bacterium]|nr:tRNA 2-thiouridine(34) synthase MnmA [Smithellaceae bacterium]